MSVAVMSNPMEELNKCLKLNISGKLKITIGNGVKYTFINMTDESRKELREELAKDVDVDDFTLVNVVRQLLIEKLSD